MPSHALLFAAEHIQSFISSSGLLRDLAGASELLENLWGEVLDQCIHCIDPENINLRFSRRAGGAFYVFADQSEVLDRLQQLWSLVVQQYTPGLEFSMVRGSSADDENVDNLNLDYLAFTQAMKKMRAAQSRSIPKLPPAASFVSRARRTGNAATQSTNRHGKPEMVDATMFRARQMIAAGSLGKRCLPAELRNQYVWPTLFESDDGNDDTLRVFPWANREQRQIAFIHADGNNMGNLLKAVSVQLRPALKDFTGEFLKFSRIIGEITEKAVQEATVQILMPQARPVSGTDKQVLPGRPIVVGGDDLSIIIRADLALDFTECFLKAFSKYSEHLLSDLKLPINIQRLSACAGVAYIHPNQPFEMALKLAESLCDHAKKQAKKKNPQDIPATLSFYRVTTSLLDDLDQLLEREASTTWSGKILRSTMESYFVEDYPQLPNLLNLKKLLAMMSPDGPLNGGASRELLGLVTQAPVLAERRYQRWKEVVQIRHGESWGKFQSLMHDLAGEPEEDDLPFGKPMSLDTEDQIKIRRSPLGDIHTLLAVAIH